MTRLRAIVVGAAVLLAGCSVSVPQGLGRFLPPPDDGSRRAGPAEVVPAYDIRSIAVNVPRTLTVSEANQILPWVDIVWRGDPPGDRYAQVNAIFEDAAGLATAQMHAGRPAILDLEVIEFHALTEKARYGIGGNYTFAFMIALRDAETGAEIASPTRVNLREAASFGQQAAEEEARGLTQKVVVTRILAKAIRDHLQRPVPAQTR